MKALSSLILVSVFTLIQTSFAQEEEWKEITSMDRKITAVAPGEAENLVMTKRTLAGKMTTNIKRFATDSIIIDLSYTAVSPKVIKFAGKEGIYKNSKGKVLQESMGKEKSFADYEVNGVTCKLLRYHMIHPDDKNHEDYEGLALMLAMDDGLYVANGVVLKEDGMEAVVKFRDSIVIRP